MVYRWMVIIFAESPLGPELEDSCLVATSLPGVTTHNKRRTMTEKTTPEFVPVDSLRPGTQNLNLVVKVSVARARSRPPPPPPLLPFVTTKTNTPHTIRPAAVVKEEDESEKK